MRAAPGDAEFFDPTMHEAPLRRIAEETGGRFYTPDNVAGLAEDVRYAGRGVTSVEERELWNMPIILIALVGLVCAEWGYRRARGLLIALECCSASSSSSSSASPGIPSTARRSTSGATTLAEASERLGVPPEHLVYLVDAAGRGRQAGQRQGHARGDRQGARPVREARRARTTWSSSC